MNGFAPHAGQDRSNRGASPFIVTHMGQERSLYVWGKSAHDMGQERWLYVWGKSARYFRCDIGGKGGETHGAVGRVLPNF